MEPKPGAPYRACRACWRTCCLACCGCRNCAPPALANANCKIFAVERCGATTGACCCSFSSSDKARSMTLDAIAALFLVLVHSCRLGRARKIKDSQLAQVFGKAKRGVLWPKEQVARRRDDFARPQCQAGEPPLRGTRRDQNNASEAWRHAPEACASPW